MSGLIGGIFNQTRSLAAQSTSLTIAGKNLANVNNPNYSRQRVNIASNTGGVEVTNISQIRNRLVDTQILRELTRGSSLEAQRNIMGTLEALLGERVNSSNDPSNTGLSAALDNFFNAFSALAANPTESAQKQNVLSSAQALVDQLNSLSRGINNIDSDIVSRINGQTSSAQQLLGDIANLNRDIAQIEVTNPGSALDLRDQRQAKIDQLSQYMNITVSDSAQGLGQVDISAASASGPISLVSAATVKGTLAYTGTGFTGGNPATALDVTGGSLAGYQSLRSNDIPSLLGGLNSIARQLVTSVNTAYGADFFRTDSGNVNLYKTAGDIQLAPGLTASTLVAGTGTDAGANNIALAIAGIANTTFGSTDSIQGTFADYYNARITAVGQKVSSLENQQIGSELVRSMLEAQRQSESGVSMDEESSNLIAFQRAYQGNARVINIMDNMLEIAVNLGNG